MKFNKLLILGLALAVSFSSCKDDEDSTPAQSLENAKPSFSASDTPIELPQAMISSDDPVAQTAVGYVESINAFTNQLALFDQIPAGATKSTTPIGRKSTNGRIEDGYLVYTWTDGQTTVAYQVSETTSTYVWEFFYQFSPDDDFVKIMKAEESKLIRSGYLEYYNFFGTTPTEDYLFKYTWNEDPDGTLYFDLLTPDNSYTINAIINPNNSGSIKYYLSGQLYYDISWDAAGAGTWTLYDSNGSVSDSGTWS